MRYEDVILADGPIAYYPLTEATGTTVTDLSGNSLNMTYANTYVLASVPFLTGSRVVYFNSGHAWCANNALFPGDTFSLETWVYPTTSTGYRSLVCLGVGTGGTGGGYMRLDTTANAIGLVRAGTANIGTTTELVTAFRWHHVVFTKTGSTMAVWLNGNLLSPTLTNQTCTTNASRKAIGGQYDDTTTLSEQTVGAMGHAAIYNKVLTASRVKEHYRAAYQFKSLEFLV